MEELLATVGEIYTLERYEADVARVIPQIAARFGCAPTVAAVHAYIRANPAQDEDLLFGDTLDVLAWSRVVKDRNGDTRLPERT